MYHGGVFVLGLNLAGERGQPCLSLPSPSSRQKPLSSGICWVPPSSDTGRQAGMST